MTKEEIQDIRYRAEMAESVLSSTKDWVTELALLDELEQAQAENERLRNQIEHIQALTRKALEGSE